MKENCDKACYNESKYNLHMWGFTSTKCAIVAKKLKKEGYNVIKHKTEWEITI